MSPLFPHTAWSWSKSLKRTNPAVYPFGRCRPMCQQAVQGRPVLVGSEGRHRTGANLSWKKGTNCCCRMAKASSSSGCVSRASWWGCSIYQQQRFLQMLRLWIICQIILSNCTANYQLLHILHQFIFGSGNTAKIDASQKIDEISENRVINKITKQTF